MRRKNWPPKGGGLGLDLTGNLGGGIAYLLNDSFLTAKAAGSVNGTAAEPGPGGNRVVRDVEAKLSLSSGLCVLTPQATPFYPDEDLLYSLPIVRAAGQAILTKVNFTTDGYCYPLVLSTSATPTYPTHIEHGFRRYNASTLHRNDSADIRDDIMAGLATATDYYLAILLGTTGALYFIKGGTYFTDWTFVGKTTGGNTANLYAGLESYNAAFAVDYIKSPIVKYTGAPLKDVGALKITNIWTFYASDADNRGIWGHTGSRLVRKIDANNDIVTIQTGNTFSGIDVDADGTAEVVNILAVWLTANPDNILVAGTVVTDPGGAVNCVNKSYVFLSTDGGVTFGATPVLKLGSPDDSFANQIANVGILGYSKLSYCLLERNLPGGSGIGNIYIAEYNTAAGRVDGGANDRVNLWVSTDDGATFSEVAHWNTDGSTHQLDHFHSIQQDPHTGYLYIVSGDVGNECGIIRWDGVAALADNTAPGDYVQNAPGLITIGGATKYKPINILFSTNYIHTFTDVNSTDSANDGIWRANKDLSNWTNQVTAIEDTIRTGWTGWCIGTSLFFSDNPTPTTDTQFINIYGSFDEGDTWYKVAKAKVKISGTASNFVGVIVYDSKVYLTLTQAYNPNSKSVIQCEAGTYNGVQEQILPPELHNAMLNFLSSYGS